MNVFKLILPATAIGAAAVLLLPSEIEAFTTLGTSLSTAQRHLRIYDNFTDATANDNVLADTNYPGYTGAEMAIWKAGIEWGSRLHGNGNGDPTQVGNLGSGGANFDFYFMGNALGVGNIGDNICSEIAGSSGGVLAFTEYFTSGFNGWRMRFYQSWTWDDGPTGSVPGANIDLQGVACHELGHSLGLDHSATSGATMFPSITGTGVTQRSIATDDINGVQSIYLVASASKPVITSLTATLGSVTINGTGFSPTGNQVWFTQAGAGNNTSIFVSGLNSSGTQITAAVPVTAGPGDVLVKISGAGNATLSNPWPFQPGTTPICASPYTYCLPSANSYSPTGSTIWYLGTQSIAANNFTLFSTNLPGSAPGLYFFASNIVFIPFGNGLRCVDGTPIYRLPIQIVDPAFNNVALTLDFTSPPVAGVITAGSTWRFQFWHRDTPAGGAGFNVSDALSVDFCP